MRAVYRLHATIFQVQPTGLARTGMMHAAWRQGAMQADTTRSAGAWPASPGVAQPHPDYALLTAHLLPPQGYRDWCRHVDLPERISELTLEKLREGGEVVVSGAMCPGVLMVSEGRCAMLLLAAS